MHRAGVEIDCQCARCGSSMDYERCTELGCEDGWIEDLDDDGFDDLDRRWRCDICRGQGGWHRCMSSPEWCKANPLEGRENVQRGEIEWFTIPERT